jgi:hypothetical protein
MVTNTPGRPGGNEADNVNSEIVAVTESLLSPRARGLSPKICTQRWRLAPIYCPFDDSITRSATLKRHGDPVQLFLRAMRNVHLEHFSADCTIRALRRKRGDDGDDC